MEQNPQEVNRPEDKSQQRQNRRLMSKITLAFLAAIPLATIYYIGLASLYPATQPSKPAIVTNNTGTPAVSAKAAAAEASPTHIIPTSTPLAPKPSNAVNEATKTPTPAVMAPTATATSKPTAKPTETAQIAARPASPPTNPPSPPTLARSELIIVPATQAYGARFVAPANREYHLQFIDGTFSSWPANGPWRTIIHIYKNRPIQLGWRIWQDKRFYEPINPDISLGSFQDWPSEEQARTAVKKSSPAKVALDTGSYLIFVYVDEQSAYADNRGSATLQVSWNQ